MKVHDKIFQKRPISNFTFKELKSQLGEHNIELCSFVEYLSLYENIKLDIELKEAGYESQILDLLKDIPIDRYVMKSFEIETLREIRKLSPHIHIGYLLSKEQWFSRFPSIKKQAYPFKDNQINETILSDVQDWFQTLQNELSLQFLSPDISIVDPVFILGAQNIGMEVWPWTVRTKKDLKRMALLDIKTIVSDIPNIKSILIKS